MMKLTLKIQPAANATAQIHEAIRRGMVRGMELIRDKAKELSPVADGGNKDTIDFEISPAGQQIKATLFTESGYGGWLEVGTGVFGPHRTPIVPVHGRFLVWPVFEGTSVDPVDWRFAKSVQGRPATPYLYPALNLHREDLAKFVKEECERVVPTP